MQFLSDGFLQVAWFLGVAMSFGYFLGVLKASKDCEGYTGKEQCDGIMQESRHHFLVNI